MHLMHKASPDARLRRCGIVQMVERPDARLRQPLTSTHLCAGRRKFGEFLEAYAAPLEGRYADVDTGADLGPCANLAALTHGQHASTGGCAQRRARGHRVCGQEEVSKLLKRLCLGSPTGFQWLVLIRGAHSSKSVVQLLACRVWWCIPEL